MEQRTGEHIEAGTIASYVEGGLSLDERRAVERHFLVCSACRDDWAEAAAVAHGRRKRLRVVVGLPTAIAAAAVVIAFLGTDRPLERALREPALRGDQREGVPRFVAVSPTEGAAVSVDSVGFSWRSEGPDAHYLLTLTNANGDVLWSIGTPDTTVALPREIGLKSNERYFWYADALLEGARSSTTGVQEFTVRP